MSIYIVKEEDEFVAVWSDVDQRVEFCVNIKAFSNNKIVIKDMLEPMLNMLRAEGHEIRFGPNLEWLYNE